MVQNLACRVDKSLGHVHEVAIDLGKVQVDVDGSLLDSSNETSPLGVADDDRILDVRGEVVAREVVLVAVGALWEPAIRTCVRLLCFFELLPWNLPWEPELRKDDQIRTLTFRAVDQADTRVDCFADVELDAGVVVVGDREWPVRRRRADEGDGQVGAVNSAVAQGRCRKNARQGGKGRQ